MIRDLKRRGGKYLNLLCLIVFALTVWSFMPRGMYAGKSISTLKRYRDTLGGQNGGYGSFAVAPGNTTFTMADSVRFNFLYDSLNLDSFHLSREAYHRAILGYLMLEIAGKIANRGVLSIIDFSLPSTMKRLFVLDMYNGRLLFNSLVAHGRSSGMLMATRFSNRPHSYMSSLGFYLTGDTYHGHNGYSLRLEGIDKGWNDNAARRAIILHPAWYVSEEHIRDRGYLGRSEGCPAVPVSLHKAIIDQIRGGSCLFLYGPDKHYMQRQEIALKHLTQVDKKALRAVLSEAIIDAQVGA